MHWRGKGRGPRLHNTSSKVIGSIVAVKLILDTFPEMGRASPLKVDIHRGALTEGLLTLAIVSVSLGLTRNSPNSFFMKTWISSVSKLALHILGSDITGGIMKPSFCNGMGLCSGQSLNKGSFIRLLACSNSGDLGRCVDFQVDSSGSPKAGTRCNQED
ncbi:hypothetical protein C5167_029759 [Papaver somniferum]|nr:hypothetical protein C5167_029759 [Papaver somniferum]